MATSLIDAVIDSTPDVEPDCDLTPIELITQLSAKRRSRVVKHLYHDIESNEIVTTRDLAKYLVLLEHGEGYTSDQRKSCYTGLYQNHLPKMVETGLVEQLDQHEFRPGPNLDAAFALIEHAEDVTGGEV